jgi:hypothetical protein
MNGDAGFSAELAHQMVFADEQLLCHAVDVQILCQMGFDEFLQLEDAVAFGNQGTGVLRIRLLQMRA